MPGQAPAPSAPPASAAPAQPPAADPLPESVAATRAERRAAQSRPANAATPATPAAGEVTGWNLVLPNGTAVALTARVVVLGRKPAAEPGAQAIPVDDQTRTMSKRHARLDWDGRVWRVTDLGSTNGVVVIDSQGTAIPVPGGSSVGVIEQFLLGDARLSLRPSA